MKATDLWTIKPLPAPGAVVKGDCYRITVLTDRLIRIEYDANGHFRDSATQMALCREFPVPEYTIAEADGDLVLETAGIILRYDRTPFHRDGLEVTVKALFNRQKYTWYYGDEGANLGGTVRTLDTINGAIPLEDGLMSRSVAVVDDSHTMDMDENGRYGSATGTAEDLYLFCYGHDHAGCIRDFLTLSGSSPVAPRFAFGNWWSRYYPYSQQGYQELMERFQAEKLPLAVSVIDMDWHVTEVDEKYGTGWTGYTWEKKLFPEPEKLTAWLHEHNLKVTLNDHPADGVRAYEDKYEAMAEAMGMDPAEGKVCAFDVADDRFMKALDKTVLEPIEDQGVDFWWLDWQQRGGTSDPTMEPLRVLNHTRYLHAVERDKPPMILSRYGGLGSHRYPIGFSGDTHITWDSLAFQPGFTATAANVAYGLWSHDIGGHMQGVKDDELTMRWVQLGVFSPIMRLHSSNNHFLNKEPWTFPVGIAKVIGDFMRLRHRMIPWLYTQNVIASRDKQISLRPMYYDYHDRALYHGFRHQFLWGDCLMVSPIVQPMDKATRLAATEVYLPEGEWTDFFTGVKYPGGRTLTMYRYEDSIPVLMRAGAVMPMDGAEFPTNGAELPQTLLWRICPNADGEGQVIEDNGLLPQHPDYRSAATRASVSVKDGLTITIHPVEGDASIVPENRAYTLELYGMPNIAPDAATCACSAAYDPARRILRLTLDATAAQGATLTWNTLPATPALNWIDRVRALLAATEMPNEDKNVVIRAAERTATPLQFLAQIRPLPLHASLIGAILEVLTAA